MVVDKKFCEKKKDTNMIDYCKRTFDETKNSVDCFLYEKTGRCRKVETKKLVKKSNPGELAEIKFVDGFKHFIGKKLNSKSKEFLNKISRPMNQIDPDSTVILKTVEATGSKSKGQNRKSDCTLGFDIQSSSRRKRLQIGISYKKNENRTIQSWSRNSFWKSLFGEVLFHKILEKMLEIVLLRAENENLKHTKDELFLSSSMNISTIGKRRKEQNQHMYHYFTLDIDPSKDYSKQQLIKKYKQILFKNHPDRSKKPNYNIEKIMKSYKYLKQNLKRTQPLHSTLKNTERMKKLQNELNLYLNESLNEKSILKLALGNDCQLYYHNDKMEYTNINDFFESEHLSNNIHGDKRYIVHKIKNKFLLDIRYIFVNKTSSNNSMTVQILWVPKRNVKNVSIETTEDCLQHGDYVPYNHVRNSMKNDLGENIKTTDLLKYYKQKFNITFPSIKKK